jgi:hypothetical protein
MLDQAGPDGVLSASLRNRGSVDSGGSSGVRPDRFLYYIEMLFSYLGRWVGNIAPTTVRS